MADRPFKLQSRDEEILAATIDGTEYTGEPQSRIEYLLLELKEVIEEGGSSSDYAAALSLTIDTLTYVMTAQLLNKDGDPVGQSQSIDLPLESTVVSGSYSALTKSLILTLVSGQTITIPIGDIISGLQAEITSQNPLDADLVDDSTSTNKFVTATDKTTWNGKQDAIDSTHKLSSDLVDDTNANNKFYKGNGVLFVQGTEPTGTIPDGAIWIDTSIT